MKHTTAHLLSFVFLAGLFTGLIVLMFEDTVYFYFTAILSTIMVLSVKLAAIFVHGPEMKKLSTRMTSSESQYESSLQLMLVLVICLKTGKFTWSSASSLLSSVLMIGKSGAESYLTFGSKNLLAETGGGWRGLIKKLKLLAMHAPVFIATTASRLTAFAVVLAWDSGTGVFVFLPLSLGTPILLSLFAKFWALWFGLVWLKDLTVLDLGRGVLAEQTTHSLWGGRGRERSKKLQIFLELFLLLLHSVFMVIVLSGVQPTFGRQRPEELLKSHPLTKWLFSMSSGFEPTNHQRPDAPPLERLQAGAIVSLATGWSSRVVLTLHKGLIFCRKPFFKQIRQIRIK